MELTFPDPVSIVKFVPASSTKLPLVLYELLPVLYVASKFTAPPPITIRGEVPNGIESWSAPLDSIAKVNLFKLETSKEIIPSFSHVCPLHKYQPSNCVFNLPLPYTFSNKPESASTCNVSIK